MATASFTCLPRHNTLAEFAGAGGWAKLLSDALTTIGVLKTPDTGQIDFATVALPGSNVIAGYEIRSITLAGGQTYYIKIEYGTGNGAGLPLLRIQVGKSTNGAGTLGATDPSTAFSLGSNTSATSFQCFVSGDASEFGFFMWAEATSNLGLAFMIGRSKDNDGADTDEYVNIVTFAAASTHSGTRQAYLPKNGPQFPATPMTNVMCGCPPSGLFVNGVNAGAFPVTPNIGHAGNPTLELAIVSNDQPFAAIVDMIIYGVVHHWVVCKGNTSYTVNGNNLALPALRYE